VVLGTPTGEGTIGTNGTMTVTITDNDSLLAFQTNQVTVAENSGTATLTVVRTGTLTETNTINYTVRAGTAKTTDYNATNGVLTFLPDQTNATITFGIVDDVVVEENEVFTVQLSRPAGGASLV